MVLCCWEKGQRWYKFHYRIVHLVKAVSLFSLLAFKNPVQVNVKVNQVQFIHCKTFLKCRHKLTFKQNSVSPWSLLPPEWVSMLPLKRQRRPEPKLICPAPAAGLFMSKTFIRGLLDQCGYGSFLPLGHNCPHTCSLGWEFRRAGSQSNLRSHSHPHTHHCLRLPAECFLTTNARGPVNHLANEVVKSVLPPSIPPTTEN